MLERELREVQPRPNGDDDGGDDDGGDGPESEAFYMYNDSFVFV